VITYCTNIHPGENWEETFSALRHHLPAIKSEFSPTEPFPVGLRLSSRAARELDDVTENRFLEWLWQHQLFVPTINGFPYGSFHASRVKEQVYLPDWRQKERVDYTMRLATLLDRWLPAGMPGSISTVPVAFGRCLPEQDMAIIRNNLLRTLEHLDHLRQKSDKAITLSLEPEPGCFLETTGDVVTFFDRLNFPDNLRSALGICLDCCHHAVEFENPAECLAQLAAAGIGIGKVQISSALRMLDPERTLLESFCEPVYLHQTVIRSKDGVLWRYKDLSDALRDHPRGRDEEWRIHFHVPIFVDRMPRYGTTRFFIDSLLPLLDKNMLLEVETYTWEVLPPELRAETVDHSIVRELLWLKGQRDETNRCP
jgi:sugar phosphate isomerase/epimerase